MWRSTIYLALFIFSSLIASAQTTPGTVSGRITDSLGRALDGATVLLVTASNETPVKSALSDQAGVFMFQKINTGSYKLVISMTGYARYTDQAFIITGEKPSYHAGDIKLTSLPANLQDVTVTAQRSPVQRKLDRTIVNADQMVSAAGSTALDVLERSPGVSVNDGAISLQGKNGVTIFIDDKPTYLSGADLENYLRSLPASSIDQIELMTNPPAKYDAAGGGGVINIRLKRTRVKGFNASLNAGYTQGVYPKTNNSFNFNYRNGKFNTFGTYGQGCGLEAFIYTVGILRRFTRYALYGSDLNGLVLPG